MTRLHLIRDFSAIQARKPRKRAYSPERLDESALLDASFREAVSAMDAGDVATLERLVAVNPALVRDRLESPGSWRRDTVGRALDGFFQRPYLLWFVAEDPVRTGRLPENAAAVARVIIDAARRKGTSNLQEQLDYALTLVSWSWIARECGAQIDMIDVLVDAGAATDGNPNNASRERQRHRRLPSHFVGLGRSFCGAFDCPNQTASDRSEGKP